MTKNKFEGSPFVFSGKFGKKQPRKTDIEGIERTRLLFPPAKEIKIK